MHIWPNGKTFPCCLSTIDYDLGNTNDKSFLELWNADRMRELRLNILNEKPTSGCSRCYETEANGQCSMRNNMNKQFKHHYNRTQLTKSDGSLDEIHMAYMDIRFSNICNMKCRTCGPELSSQWVDDAVKTGRYPADAPKILKVRKTLVEFWDDLNPWIDSIENIYFAGGEPLIMDEHYKILEHLIEIGKTDIFIYYNTNLSKLVYKNKDVVELWKYFKYIDVSASIDALGERAEYMRSGTKWSDIIANINRIKTEVPHVEFNITPTVSIYNIMHITDFLAEFLDREYVTLETIGINVLLFPEYMRIEVLPDDLKEQARAKLLEFIDQYGTNTGINSLLACLDKDRKELLPDFKKFNDKLDAVRQESLTKIFNELESAFDE